MTQQGFHITIDTTGIEGMIKKTRDPQFFKGPILGLLRRVGRRNKKVMVANIDGGMGFAVRSIFTQFDRQKFTTLTSTHINPKRAQNIEGGRQTGILPNSQAVARWMESEGLETTRETVSEMMHKIRREGVEGKDFTKITFEDIEKRLPGYIKSTIKQIEKRWSKKRGLG